MFGIVTGLIKKVYQPTYPAIKKHEKWEEYCKDRNEHGLEYADKKRLNGEYS